MNVAFSKLVYYKEMSEPPGALYIRPSLSSTLQLTIGTLTGRLMDMDQIREILVLWREYFHHSALIDSLNVTVDISDCFVLYQG